MRTLVLIRHAKARWPGAGGNDFDRPLNERGEDDARMMGRQLKERGLKADLIISSTAKRTKQTAERIAAAIDYDKKKIQWEEKLYHCSVQGFEDVIRSVPDNCETIFIVAHNPGITDFVNELSPDFNTDHVPTCGVVVAHVNAKHWSEFLTAERTVFLFEYPKKES